MSLQQTLQDFKDFATKGNVVDMAVGVIIGGAFGTIVKSLVDDVIMPPIGMLLGNVDFTELFLVLKPGSTAAVTLAEAKKAGAVTVNYGLFINSVVTFTIIAFAMFMVIRSITKLQSLKRAAPAVEAEPTTKDCPYCRTAVPKLAVRCGHCTSKLADGELPVGVVAD